MVQERQFRGLAAKLVNFADVDNGHPRFHHIRGLSLHDDQISTPVTAQVCVVYNDALGFFVLHAVEGEELGTKFLVNKQGEVEYFTEKADLSGRQWSDSEPATYGLHVGDLSHSEKTVYVNKRVKQLISELSRCGLRTHPSRG